MTSNPRTFQLLHHTILKYLKPHWDLCDSSVSVKQNKKAFLFYPSVSCVSNSIFISPALRGGLRKQGAVRGTVFKRHT